MNLGLPTTPLPSRWWRGLSRARIARIIHTETTGSPRVCPTLDPKGYVWLFLGRGHPYADAAGKQRLHRWLMMRHLGRRLARYEHVHHTRDAPKDTTDVARLGIMHEIDHGRYHWGRWICCGPEMTEEEERNA